MASLQSVSNVEVSVPTSEIVENATYYIIIVKFNNLFWNVRHRYSEFFQLHTQLVANQGIAKDLLPGKKLIGSKDAVFIDKRRNELELYLKTVLSFTYASIPVELASFLEFGTYELTYLLQDLAQKCFKCSESGEDISANSFNPLQLKAICEQLKNPNSEQAQVNSEKDFSHVAELCSKTTDLRIEGSNERYRQSNIVWNMLPFGLGIFRNLKTLELWQCNATKIETIGPSRVNIQILRANNCQLEKLSDLLQPDSLHKDVADETLSWREVQTLDVSNNAISEIDNSILLVPKVEVLHLQSNRLKSLNFLTKLPQLVQLDLSRNLIHHLEDAHLKLGNLVELNLAQNRLSDLSGLSKMYCLVFLNLASNNVPDVGSVRPITGLPCLENVVLTSNPVALSIDYRTRVLELFDKRACEVSLDNERASSKEADQIAVLQALRIAREGRLPILEIATPQPTTISSLRMLKTDSASIAK